MQQKYGEAYLEIMLMLVLVKLRPVGRGNNRNARDLLDLNQKYCGVKVRKHFGELGVFEGVVQYQSWRI